MSKAIFKGEVIAESNKVKSLKGKKLFPHSSLNKKYFRKSYTQYADPELGTASFYNVLVNGEVIWNAAMYFPKPAEKLERIKDYVFFTNHIEVRG